MARNREQGTVLVYFARGIGNTPQGTIREQTIASARKLDNASKKVRIITMEDVPDGRVITRLDGTTYVKGESGEDTEPRAKSEAKVEDIPKPPTRRPRRSKAKATPPPVDDVGGFDNSADKVASDQVDDTDDDDSADDDSADDDNAEAKSASDNDEF